MQTGGYGVCFTVEIKSFDRKCHIITPIKHDLLKKVKKYSEHFMKDVRKLREGLWSQALRNLTNEGLKF